MVKWTLEPHDNDQTVVTRAAKSSKILDTIDALASSASIIPHISSRMGPKEVIAIGMMAGSTVSKLVELWKPQPKPPETFFRDHHGKKRLGTTPGTEEWTEIPPDTSKVIFAGEEIGEPEYHLDYATMTFDSSGLNRGSIYSSVAQTSHYKGVEIGWVGPLGGSKRPWTIFTRDLPAVEGLLIERAWKSAYLGKYLLITEGVPGPIIPPTNEECFTTEALRKVKARVELFIEKKVPRVILLDGPPGTGKSFLCLWLAGQLNTKTVVAEASDVLTGSWARGEETEGSTLSIIKMLAPEVIILNDLDRTFGQEKLLPFLERARDYAKIIFITVNDTSKLLDAVRRPGRVDDILVVGGLTLEEIQSIAPELNEVHERMVGWPFAYVQDMRRRFQVLGHQAIDEFDSLAARVTMPSSPDDDDDDDDSEDD